MPERQERRCGATLPWAGVVLVLCPLLVVFVSSTTRAGGSIS